jgi:hypothetical protein
MSSLGMSTSDFGSVQPAAMIHLLNTPAPHSLVSVPVSSVHNGGGSYTISWTVPPGTVSYRIKWSSKTIVDWIGFDPITNQFSGNPATTTAWFAANAGPSVAPANPGATQSVTINTGVTGLTAGNFSVKAYVTGGGSGNTTTLAAISGGGQSAAAGTALSSPFTVKVSDSGGNGIAGVTVTFSVIAGGGSLSVANVNTNSLGLASTVLTLGTTPGTNTVMASAPVTAGSPVTFTATGLPSGGTGIPSTLTVNSGNGQTGATGQQLPLPLVVRIADASGNAVAGVAVAFAVTAGGGTLSAGSVVTNSLGLAQTTWTLGPAVGTNTVVASSTSLPGVTATFTATATNSAAPAQITWTRQPLTAGWPGWVGWHLPLYDPVSRQTLFYVVPASYRGIYSTTLFAYDSSTNLFTNIGGTNSTENGCPESTNTMPGDRHPVRQMAIDTKRNFLWIYGGANGTCAQHPRQDMYYMRLNANPATNTWTKVSPSRIPVANALSSMVYDSDNDVLFVFGSDGSAQTRNHWVYCRTMENPTPGTLTAKQSAAGCNSPDDWSEVSVAGGIRPSAVTLPGLVYDPVTKKVVLFGGMDSGLQYSFNETWVYDVPTRTWTRKALSTTPPPVYVGDSLGQPPVAYAPGAKLYYHQTSGAGAPGDWLYDIVADTWTKLASSGGGSPSNAFMAYDSKNNVLVSWNQIGPAQGAEVWLGALSTASSRCDVNADNTVNILDVQQVVNQVLGLVACSTGDIDRNGLCNVTDVQLVINAVLTGMCQASP